MENNPIQTFKYDFLIMLVSFKFYIILWIIQMILILY